MARVPIYKNSIGASFLSIVGYVISASGLFNLFDKNIVDGIVILLIGVAISFLASVVSDEKQRSDMKNKKSIQRDDPKN